MCLLFMKFNIRGIFFSSTDMWASFDYITYAQFSLTIYLLFLFKVQFLFKENNDFLYCLFECYVNAVTTIN